MKKLKDMDDFEAFWFGVLVSFGIVILWILMCVIN